MIAEALYVDLEDLKQNECGGEKMERRKISSLFSLSAVFPSRFSRRLEVREECLSGR